MTEREQFEAWAREYGYDIDEPYDPAHADAWLGWNARAARPQPAQAVPLLSDSDLRWMWAKHAGNVGGTLDYGREIEQAVRAKLGAAQWQPISTAPKDEAVWLGSAIRQQAFVGKWKDYMRYNSPQVTHWMPLPPPPGIVGKEGA